MEKVYWITKQGQKLDIDNMSDAHVRNAFKMILRHSKLLKEQEEAKKKALEDFYTPKKIERRLIEEGIQHDYNDMYLDYDDLAYDNFGNRI
jgi:hypothetical protein